MTGSTSPSTPAVSVIMAVYNGQATVARAIKSILEQSNVLFELVIVNDGSTDQTSDILRTYAAQDDRIRLFETENRGLTEALIHGIEHVRGAYIARQDADDVSLPGRLRQQVDWMHAHPECVLLGTNAAYLQPQADASDAPAMPESDKAIRKALRSRNAFFHSSVLMRRDAYARVGGYRAFFRYSQDYDLWTRMAGVGQLANLPSRLLRYRRDPAGITFQRLPQQQKYAALASTLYYARRAFAVEIDPSDKLWDLHFSEDPPTNAALQRHYHMYLNCNKLGSAPDRIEDSRWSIFRQGFLVDDPGVALRFWTYALFGKHLYQALRTQAPLRRMLRFFS